LKQFFVDHCCGFAGTKLVDNFELCNSLMKKDSKKVHFKAFLKKKG
jgi:hypothetical protein